ncbi:MAG TPA: hypothetical protein VE643_03760 [Nitrososphaeraceae archaeon]|nr:hypothetical protein [Nitrososphaeraceae archaeon]
MREDKGHSTVATLKVLPSITEVEERQRHNIPLMRKVQVIQTTLMQELRVPVACA